jgi:hypothetical protein
MTNELDMGDTAILQRNIQRLWRIEEAKIGLAHIRAKFFCRSL